MGVDLLLIVRRSWLERYALPEEWLVYVLLVVHILVSYTICLYMGRYILPREIAAKAVKIRTIILGDQREVNGDTQTFERSRRICNSLAVVVFAFTMFLFFGSGQ